MPREFFSVAAVSDTSLDSLNQLVADINTRMTDITVAIAQLEGYDSFKPKLLGDLDLNGKRIVNAGASKLDSDITTRGELVRHALYRRRESDSPETDFEIRARGGIRTVATAIPAGVPTLAQIQAGFASVSDPQTITGAKTFTGGVTIGATGTAITALLIASAALNFGNTLAQTSSDLTITVTGAVDGNVVILGVPNAAVLADSCYTAWVSAVDTVTVRFSNYSAGALNPASATFTVAVIK